MKLKVFLLEIARAISINIGLIGFLLCIIFILGHYTASTITYQVSIIPLTTNSWLYHGKKVETRGFLQLDFESNRLHLNQESYEKKLDNYIWLEITRQQTIDYKALDRHYVIVEGTFQDNFRRRLLLDVGSIKVTRLQGIGSDRYILK